MIETVRRTVLAERLWEISEPLLRDTPRLLPDGPWWTW